MSTKKWRTFLLCSGVRGDAMEHWGNHIPRGLIRDLCITPHLRRHFRDSGLVMCVSTLPSPSLSVPCIWGILQSLHRKSGAFRRKTILKRSLSVKHPKGARSIGIGHPRSGDRCTKTLPYPLDPLWVAEQSLQRPRQGVALIRESGTRCDTLAGSRCRL